jgi:hypothetical protein
MGGLQTAHRHSTRLRMSCKIERLATQGMVVFRVSGHIQSEHVKTIQELIAREEGPMGLDLKELTLVHRDAVSYLALCELRGIELRNCPRFLRDWVTKEQLR